MSALLDVPQARDRLLFAGVMETLGSERRVAIDAVSWDAYADFLAAYADQRPGVRVHYFEGRMAVVSTGSRHERWKKLLARLLELMAVAKSIDILALGEVTIRRRDMLAGLEPDECYYVGANARPLAIDHQLDFTTDPPLDLALEVEHTHGVDDKLAIYAALGIRELWRFDGNLLTFWQLVAGQYEPLAESLAFPGTSPALFEAALARIGIDTDTTVCRNFYDSLRG